MEMSAEFMGRQYRVGHGAIPSIGSFAISVFLARSSSMTPLAAANPDDSLMDDLLNSDCQGKVCSAGSW
jgi:hypothetical protein